MNAAWQIPTNWQWSTMGDVADIIGGGTPKSDQTEYFGGDIPWITPADLSGYKEKFISTGARSITRAGLDNSGARLMPAGTVLFSSRAPIGYVAIAQNPVCTNQGFKSFVLRDGLTSDFVYYYLQHAKEIAVALASGTTFLEISGKKAAQIPIPVAPLAEQRRIVEEIEKQFTRLEAGVAALKRVQANLKRYRAAVLKAACGGELVPKRSNWVETTLGAVTEEKVLQAGPKGKSKFIYVDISSIDNMTKRVVRPKTLSVVNAPSRAKQNLTIGDVLVSMTRPNLNAIAFVTFELDGSIGSTGFHVLRARDVNPKWLFYIVQTNNFVDVMCKLVQGALYPAVRPKDIRAYSFFLPSKAEQKQIVAEVERRLSVVEELEAVVKLNLDRATRLRQSILQQAFEGKLWSH